MIGSRLSASLTYLRFNASLINLILAYDSEISDRKEESNPGYSKVLERANELENDKNGRMNLELCYKIKISVQYIRDMVGIVYYGLISAQQAKIEVLTYINNLPLLRSGIPRSSRGV